MAIKHFLLMGIKYRCLVVNKVFNLNEVSDYCGISISTINRHRKINDFPEAIKLGERRIGFLIDEIDKWIFDRDRKKGGKVSVIKKKIRCPQTPLELEKIVLDEYTEMKARKTQN